MVESLSPLNGLFCFLFLLTLASAQAVKVSDRCGISMS